MWCGPGSVVCLPLVLHACWSGTWLQRLILGRLPFWALSATLPLCWHIYITKLNQFAASKLFSEINCHFRCLLWRCPVSVLSLSCVCAASSWHIRVDVPHSPLASVALVSHSRFVLLCCSSFVSHSSPSYCRKFTLTWEKRAANREECNTNELRSEENLTGEWGEFKIRDECFEQFKTFASVRRTEENAE